MEDRVEELERKVEELNDKIDDLRVIFINYNYDLKDELRKIKDHLDWYHTEIGILASEWEKKWNEKN